MGINCDLVAVVMAGGKGSRMTELTARRPKCTLPIGNFPMIYYPLMLLERSGFKDVIIVTLESAKSEVAGALDRCGLRIKCDFVGIQGGDDWGTADTLRHLQETNKIKSDVLIVSCDLISDIDLTPFLDLYRQHDASIAALYVPGKNWPGLPTPGPKTKEKAERDLVGICETTSRLVFLASASDYEEDLPLSRNLLKRYGRFTLSSKLLDTHIYIIRKWLCQYLAYNKSLSTLKGEVLPYVVKKQMSTVNKPILTKVDDKASLVASDLKTEISHFAEEEDLTLKVRNMSNYTDNSCQPVYNGDAIRCYAYVDHKSEFTIRTNTHQQYTTANRKVLDFWPVLTNRRELVAVSPLAVVGSTQLDSTTCLVAEHAKISEKTSIKSSIVGVNAQISPKTQLKDSIVMAGAVIGQGCNIQNCVICEESCIEDNCDLKDCLVGSHHTVPAQSKHTNEVLTVIDRLMEI